jgi:hypothetical protein
VQPQVHPLTAAVVVLVRVRVVRREETTDVDILSLCWRHSALNLQECGGDCVECVCVCVCARARVRVPDCYTQGEQAAREAPLTVSVDGL